VCPKAVAHSAEERFSSIVIHIEETKKLRQLFANIALRHRDSLLTGWS